MSRLLTAPSGKFVTKTVVVTDVDFASIPTLTTGTADVTVLGAAVGMQVTASPLTALTSGLVQGGHIVTAANTVRLALVNATAGAIDPASISWAVTVTKV